MSLSSDAAEIVALLESALTAFPCEKRYMFGCQVYFAEGSMFAGVHNHSIFLRLSAPDRESFFAHYNDARPFEPIAGRIVREYVVLPASLPMERAALEGWLERSYRYAASLAAKPQRGRQGKGE